jgi:hypothetical protein
MTYIVNGAPMTYMEGIDDGSRTLLLSEREAIPQHLPVIFFFGEKGPLDRQLVSGNARINTYGAASFDEIGPYATHTTILSNVINAKANMQIMQRLRPADAPKPAALRLWQDVLATKVPEYEIGEDGSIVIDPATGKPKETGIMLDGFKVKYVVGPVPLGEDGEDTFGLASIGQGDQTDETAGKQSKLYPIGDFEVPHFGKGGNNSGLRIFAPTMRSQNPVDDRLITEQKVYPFRMACVKRADDLSTAQVVTTQNAEQFVDVCFKKGLINKRVGKKVYAGDVFIDAYQDLNNPVMTPAYGPFGKMHLYQANIDLLLTQYYAAEKLVSDPWSDFKAGDTDEQYRFNMISGQTSAGTQYHTFKLVTGEANSVRLTESSNLWAVNGGDGTMTNATLDALVKIEALKYADELSPLQDISLHPESIIYDSGFGLSTKYALLSPLGSAVRKDMFVVLSTHVVGERQLTASEESSVAVMLRTRAQMYPESELFGTPVVRALIMGRSGTLLNTQFADPLPLTIELASKAAGFMGAADGKWKKVNSFDRAPNNKIEMFVNINVNHTPAKVRNKDWAIGLNWIEAFERRSVFWPALKTVYEYDDSVLTGFFNVLGACQVQKVGYRAQKQFTGAQDLSELQLIAEVNEWISAELLDRFAGRFIFNPITEVTAADRQRNYSWHSRVEMGMPGMKSVESFSIHAKRIEDMA